MICAQKLPLLTRDFVDVVQRSLVLVSLSDVQV